jgi:hypothetical protein
LRALQAQQAHQHARFQLEQRLITSALYNVGVRMQEAGLVEHIPGAEYAHIFFFFFIMKKRKESFRCCTLLLIVLWQVGQ